MECVKVCQEDARYRCCKDLDESFAEITLKSREIVKYLWEKQIVCLIMKVTGEDD